jgi:hypothetical protein
MEARLPSHCCHGKGIGILHVECVHLALIIYMQNACAILYCLTGPLRLCHVFLCYLTKDANFEKNC